MTELAERWKEQNQTSDLVPGVSSVSGIDEDGDDLGFGEESCSSLSSHLRVKVVGTFLKVVV